MFLDSESKIREKLDQGQSCPRSKQIQLAKHSRLARFGVPRVELGHFSFGPILLKFWI